MAKKKVILLVLIASIRCQFFSQNDPDFFEVLSPSLSAGFTKGIRVSIQSTHETKEVIEHGTARKTSENFLVPEQFAKLGANVGSYQLKKFQKVIQVD